METKKLIGGLLAGAAIGVAVGLLLAPRSGEQTQKKLIRGSKRFANDFKNTVGDSIESLRGKYNGAIDETAKRGKEVLSSVSDKLKA
ncbi:MAG TPA: YtxH domain-containing protein [Chryseolinea sp.]|nr:YtxH domain-containing protein [Chryseolinea sp.]HPM31435.1 YtxH domain-containing protein [Chryseolinea sp.]